MANGEVSYAIRSYTLGAGEVVRIDRHSGFLACLASTDVFKVAFDDGEENDFEAGITYSPIEGFRSVQIRNDGASTNTIKLGFGKGNIKDARLNLAGSITNREEVPDDITDDANRFQASGTSGTLVAADANRKEVFATNEGPGKVWLKSSNSAIAKGLPLVVGQSAVIETTAEVFVFAETDDAYISRFTTRFSS